jgi:tripartite-type tricarboxylate transporter receptor subunit TctC
MELDQIDDARGRATRDGDDGSGGRRDACRSCARHRLSDALSHKASRKRVGSRDMTGHKAAWSFTRRAVIAGTFAASAMVLMPAHAQDGYPSKMIRLLVPFPAGSATDVEARFLAEKVGVVLGQKILVDNKPGANANIGAAEVARAAGDGYTLYLATNSTHSANVHLYNKMPFDPVADFTPIARLTRNPLVMVVNKDFPAKDLKEFIAYGKANPGKLSYGSGNTGSMAAAQLVRSLAGIDAVRISYPGTPQAITDLLGGRIEFVITDVAVTREFINNGSLRALGVTTVQRVASLPNVAPMAEVGLPGYDFAAWSGLFGPKNVPADVVEKLNKAFLQVMATDEAKKFFADIGLEPDVSSPAGLAEHVTKQTELWGKIIKESGLEKI